MNKFKKLIISFLLSIFALVNLAGTAKAETWYNQSPINWFNKVYSTSVSPESEIFGERYTAAQVQWIFYSIMFMPFTLTNPELLSCITTGDIGTCVQAVISKSEPNTPPLAQKPSPPGIVDQIFADRPLSGITYVKDLFRKFHIIPEAQAQSAGFGFGALDPIRQLWVGSRNIAYTLLILVTLVMAFMIMFRVKISPQVVISVQSALPKVITAIILVTFSYAIAGFLIDLMYVVIGLISLMFTNYIGEFFGLAAPGIFNLLTTGQFAGTALGINAGVLFMSVAYLFLFMFVLLVTIVATIGLVASVLLSPVIGLLLFIVGLIAFVLLIIHIIRIIFMLIRAFAMVLLLTIFAPFYFIFGTVVPNLGFTTWARTYVSNLAIFVVTGVLFLMSFFFLIQSFILTLQGTGIGLNLNIDEGLSFISNAILGTANPISRVFQFNVNPSLQAWPPLLGSGDESAMGFVFLGVSFVLFTMIPRTAEIIQGAISGRPFAFGTAIGEAVGGAGAIGAATNLGVAGVLNWQRIQDFRNSVFRTPTPTVDTGPATTSPVIQSVQEQQTRGNRSRTA